MKVFDIDEHLKIEVQKTVDKLFKKDDFEVGIEEPPKREFGEYSTPIALSIAKKQKAKAEDIAEKITEKLGKIELVEKIEIKKPGYINFFLDYPKLFQLLTKEAIKDTKQLGKKLISGKPKLIIEHTAVNPNKAMHIGHLRNSVLGDSLARICIFAGYDVEIENYIDDTGMQVALLILGLTAIKEKRFKDCPKERDYKKLDYYYWDVYSWIFEKLDSQQKDYKKLNDGKIDLHAQLKEIVRSLEEHKGNYYDFGKKIAFEMVNAHLKTNSRLNIFYDLLVWESTILKVKLWESAFELLKKNDKFIYRKSGKNKGCWVLDYGSDRKDKIFVRSDGTAVYVAKDFAYHLWKFGLVPDPFKYFVWFIQPNGKKLFSTKGSKEYRGKISFGNVKRIINVIDKTQAYEQKAVADSLKYIGYQEQAKNFFHLAYGKVSLSKATTRFLGVKVTEDRKSYPMSGREGVGVKVDDLIDLMIRDILLKRKQENEFKVDKKTAAIIAIAAVRYFLLKMRYDSELVFDTKDALSTTGNTGVYLLYSQVRALNILMKSGGDVKLKNFKFTDLKEQEKNLINQITKFNSAIKGVLQNNDPSIFAEYTFDLATKFSSFYNSIPVLQAEREEVRAQRLILVKIFSEVMESSLELLGIPVLKRM